MHASKSDGRGQQRQPESGAKRKWNDNQDAKEAPDSMLSGWSKNRNGNRASPAVRHALKNVEKLPEAEKKRIAPALRRAMVVENIAANFVSSGNSQDLIQELSRLTDKKPVGQ